ncbi:MAG: 3-deoxy-D-manno-octulosonate 8-phosphate phosphatase, YrbI family [candidate division TM6 bacterium GW2011_GWF2_32_72]|nr:MAG: 3-deoxy-D-manno-octulosonate 8-phosphate phosphatase, YrbI family [candidate division TM6 bacterium GW2011_GWF2_32_72]
MFIQRDAGLWFKAMVNNCKVVERLKKVKMIITDVDGTLTEGYIYFSESGDEFKNFSVQDGYGIALAQEQGLLVGVISGRDSIATIEMAKDRNIPANMLYQGVMKNKVQYVEKMQKMHNLNCEETLYFGDDVLDIQVKKNVCLFASPDTALFYIQEASDFVVPKCGGCGAFRLLIDLILYVQGKHFAQDVISQAIDKVSCL